MPRSTHVNKLTFVSEKTGRLEIFLKINKQGVHDFGRSDDDMI